MLTPEYLEACCDDVLGLYDALTRHFPEDSKNRKNYGFRKVAVETGSGIRKTHGGDHPGGCKCYKVL